LFLSSCQDLEEAIFYKYFYIINCFKFVIDQIMSLSTLKAGEGGGDLKWGKITGAQSVQRGPEVVVIDRKMYQM
jgi:hypothetical protein